MGTYNSTNLCREQLAHLIACDFVPRMNFYTLTLTVCRICGNDDLEVGVPG